MDGSPDGIPGRGIHTKLLGYLGDFPRRHHNANAKKQASLTGQHPQHQHGGLQKGGQAGADDLLAPGGKPAGKASGNTHHVQFPHRNLDQENPSPLDIVKEYLNTAVGKKNQKEQGFQGIAHIQISPKDILQDIECRIPKASLLGGEDGNEVTGEDALQRYGKLIQCIEVSK